MSEQDEVEQACADLGEALVELKAGLDEVLAKARQRLDEKAHEPVGQDTEVTPDVGGAMWQLVRGMPSVIGDSLSGNEERVGRARDRLARLDGRLRAAGVDLGDGLTGYADRLAGLRGERGASASGDGDRPGRGG